MGLSTQTLGGRLDCVYILWCFTVNAVFILEDSHVAVFIFYINLSKYFKQRYCIF